MSNNVKYTMAGLTALTTLIVTGIVTADTYSVQAGDSLSKIALENNTSVENLVAWNHISNPAFIQVGQKLEVGDGKGNAEATKAAKAALTAVSEENVQEAEAAVTKASEATATATEEGSSSVYGAPAVNASNAGIVLANGNTAGATGSYAAQQMAARTGVSATVWEGIIARESNGDVNAANPSGASGLFQTMPGWGSTATVEDQINAAVKAYNAQGLSAWGY